MERISLTINHIIEQAHKNATVKGFWNTPQSFPESLALIHSELSEALEDFRDGRPVDVIYSDGNGKPCGIPVELADVIIRICDLAGYHNIDLETAILRKMQYNRERPHMHGKII